MAITTPALKETIPFWGLYLAPEPVTPKANDVDSFDALSLVGVLTEFGFIFPALSTVPPGAPSSTIL